MHLFILERLPVFSKYTEITDMRVDIVSDFGVKFNFSSWADQSGGHGVQTGPIPGKSQVLYKHAFETNRPPWKILVSLRIYNPDENFLICQNFVVVVTS